MSGMGRLFGELLKQHREALGVSGYQICKESGMPSALFVEIEKGKRPPSQANLDVLASSSSLAVTPRRLAAWKMADKIGREGFDLIRDEVPELFSAPAPRVRVLAAALDPLAAVAGPGAPPLSPAERRAVQHLLGLAGGDLRTVNMGPDEPFWCYEGGDRLAAINMRIMALGGQAVDAREA